MEEETIDLPADNIEDKKEKIRKLVEEGYTNREIADRTGIPFGTVGYHAARFRKKEKEPVDNSDRHLCKSDWIPISERLPDTDEYVLLSFENYTMAAIGRYEENDEGGTFYPGDDEKSYSSYGIFVNAWMPLPEPYREEQ